MSDFDVAVCGLGVTGSAALHVLARRGALNIRQVEAAARQAVHVRDQFVDTLEQPFFNITSQPPTYRGLRSSR